MVALGAILSCSLPSIGAGQSTETPTAPEPAATPLTSATAGPQSVSLSEPAAGTMMRWLDGSELVFVPAGVFSMGDDSPDAPRHSVSLSGFWIQRTEVTNRQYALCVQLGSCLVPKEIHSVVGLSDASLRDYPVTNLSWSQAQAYCEWITGGLPTEAEWEKAARGQHGSTYPWGEADPQPALLNFADAAGAPQRVTAHIVGRSPYGALDMAGNVFEWVQDWYGEGYYLDSPSADPPGPGDGVLRSVRSSAFSSGQGVVRAASRSFAPPEAFRSDLGLRCVVRQPAPIASLCRSSAFIVGDAAPTGGSCSPTVTASAFSCAAGDGLGTVDIGGGTVTSVEVVDPEDRTSTCDIYRGRRLACRVKDPGAAIQVRYCVTCAGEESTSAPPEIVRPAGTAAGGDPARRGECIATDPTAARVCSDGMVPDAASPRSCIPNPCPAGEVPDPRDPSACIANPCPAGSHLPRWQLPLRVCPVHRRHRASRRTAAAACLMPEVCCPPCSARKARTTIQG